MGEVIGITSGKGGVGKTTTTANDGKCRSSQGPRACRAVAGSHRNQPR